MIKSKCIYTVCKIIVLQTCFCGCLLHAQEQDEVTVAGVPLENSITGRDVALRLRFEAQLTEDSDDVIDIDPLYKSYPARMYAGEVRMFQKNRLSFGASYESWENDQGLDASFTGWLVSSPVTEKQSLLLRYRRFTTTGSSDRDYFHVGINGYLTKTIYSSAGYRYMMQPEADNSEHQFSEYLSWTPVKRFRIGTQVTVSESDAGGPEPWQVRLFGSIWMVEDWTSLRCEYQNYQYIGNLSFDEYRAYLYQRIGSQSLVRLGCRYYEDSSGLSSVAPDIKIKHYFKPSFSVHAGYRTYTHVDDTSLNTFTAGMEVIF